MFFEKVDIKLDDLAAFLNQKNDFVWLDSASGGEVSILAANHCDHVVFTEKDSGSTLKSFLESLPKPAAGLSSDLPFSGGWIGFFSYESFVFNPLIPLKPRSYPSYPLAEFYRYDAFFLVNHKEGSIYFVRPDNNDREPVFEALKAWLLTKPITPRCVCSNHNSVLSKTTRHAYGDHFFEIQKSLSAGDYFELNYTTNNETPWAGDAFALYKKLRATCPAPMMAFLRFPDVSILSASPETFFEVNGDVITVEPIKGTRARNSDPLADQRARKALKESQKDRAELLMVTDMLRNDLGRICMPSTIRPELLFHLKSFSHYHHLVSRIRGLLKPGTGVHDIFYSLFPGGSITGAPKIKVMEHISRLENRARGIYTGAVGYFSHNGRMHFNIPIRTLVHSNNILEFATGGGIVADSDVDEEFEECRIKACGLLEALLGF